MRVDLHVVLFAGPEFGTEVTSEVGAETSGLGSGGEGVGRGCNNRGVKKTSTFCEDDSSFFS